MIKVLFAMFFIMTTQAAMANPQPEKFYKATNRLATAMGLSMSSKQFKKTHTGDNGCTVRAEITRAYDDGIIREMFVSVKGTQFILSELYTTAISEESQRGYLKFETLYSYSFPDQQFQSIEIEVSGDNARINIYEQGKKQQVCGGLKLNLDEIK